MKFYKSLLIFIFCLSYVTLNAQKVWETINSVEDFYETYPSQADSIFSAINLDYTGLKKAKIAFEKGKKITALKEILRYYDTKEMPKWMYRSVPQISDKTDPKVNHILDDIFIVQNVANKVPILENGHRDWYYTGKYNEKEWAMISNRHHQLDTMRTSFFNTGNPKYANYIDAFLKDFITASWPYPEKQEWGVLWRGLEISFRAKAWAKIFYEFRNTKYISDATRLLMLASLPDHAHYNRNFHIGGNWLAMEISGLANVAGYFPEYKKSPEWMEYAMNKLTWSSKNQTYPDGVQNELTSHYHRVAVENFLEFEAVCNDVGVAITDELESTIKKMLAYTAKTMRPNGMRILNNDGDLADDRDFTIQNAKKYDTPELIYISTNGKEGIKPTDGPSYIYPWAGHLISRNGFHKDAHWSFFDIGPYGSTHQHKDKLHISIHAYGRDLLVDSGRFAYSGEIAKKFREYALSSFGHNTICIDGKSQSKYEGMAKKAIDTKNYKLAKTYDYASASMSFYENLEGEATHTRALAYVKNKFWLVADKITSDRKRNLDINWIWHPRNNVKVDGTVVKTENDRGNLKVIPITNQKFTIKIEKGEENPVRAWYSREYNIFEPTPNTKYTCKSKSNEVLAWLLVPYESEAPNITTKIISITDDEIKVSVSINDVEIEVGLPFENSNNVSVTLNRS